jgi:hypothetical protein
LYSDKADALIHVRGSNERIGLKIRKNIHNQPEASSTSIQVRTHPKADVPSSPAMAGITGPGRISATAARTHE